jgi:hypothetical protein
MATKFVDGMRVRMTRENSWLAAMKWLDAETDAEEKRTSENISVLELRKTVARRIGLARPNNMDDGIVPAGSTGTIRHMTFYSVPSPKPLPSWLLFHRNSPKFEEWKQSFYNKEGNTSYEDVGIYTNADEPPEGGIRRYGIWTIEFDGLEEMKAYGVCGLAADNVLPSYLEVIKE